MLNTLLSKLRIFLALCSTCLLHKKIQIQFEVRSRPLDPPLGIGGDPQSHKKTLFEQIGDKLGVPVCGNSVAKSETFFSEKRPSYSQHSTSFTESPASPQLSDAPAQKSGLGNGIFVTQPKNSAFGQTAGPVLDQNPGALAQEPVILETQQKKGAASQFRKKKCSLPKVKKSFRLQRKF